MSDHTARNTARAPGRRAAFALVVATAAVGAAYAFAPSATGPAAAPAAQTPPITAAAAGVRFSARLDRTRVLAGGDGLVRAELLLAADAVEGAAEPVPTDVVVLLDTSSSMAGEKFDDAVGAVQGLIARLRPADRFALVPYSSHAAVSIPLGSATPAAVEGWRRLVAGLTPGGSTNIEHALALAEVAVVERSEAQRPVRVLLVSDGEPTAGDTDPAALVQRARGVARRGAVLGGVGVGLGFNEVLMASIADAGTGNFHSLHGEGGLDAILAAEFDAARKTVASGMVVELRPAPGVEVIDAAGYPLERRDGAVAFRPGALASGQTRSVWVTLKVPATGAGVQPLGAAALRFAADGARGVARIDALPSVERAQSEAAFVAGLDRAAWEQSVVSSAFADVQKQVAVAVRNGEADAARALLDAHHTRTAALNRAVGSAAVDTHLADVAKLRAEVDDAFTGAGQAHKQNVFSKSNLRDGWQRSRRGSF